MYNFDILFSVVAPTLVRGKLSAIELAKEKIMPARYTLSLKDFESSIGTVSVWSTLLTAGNFAAQLAAAQAFRDAIAPMSLLPLTKEAFLALETKYTVAAPLDVNAQRGRRWLVRMLEDTTGNSVTFNVPGADLQYLSPGSKNADLTDATVAAFVAATEAYVRSNDGNSVTVTEIVHLD